jgi:hypothetical protein
MPATTQEPRRSNGKMPPPALPARRGRPPKIPPLAPGEVEALKSTPEPEKAAPEVVRITRPKLRSAIISITGISPYVQHAFSEKQRKVMEETQRAGQQAKGKRARAPKDFEAVYEAAKHISKDGWLGIPAPAFRNAMISACRLIGFKMTHAKLSVFVEADGIDAKEGTPLVRIEGKPRIHEASVRNASGVADIRWRPMWEEWGAKVRVTWDEEQFSATDVMNLMLRAGLQVGIGEGRPDSPNSNGLGWGRFEVAGL